MVNVATTVTGETEPCRGPFRVPRFEAIAAEMSPKHSLEGMIALAQAHDGNRTAALLRAATELFVSAPAHDRSEVHLYEELVLNLLPDADLAERRALARSLATAPDAPRLVVRELLSDDISVAAELIDGAPQLAEIDLLTAIATGSPAHMTAIARRSFLPKAVVEALCFTGPPESRRMLAANIAAAFTPAARSQIILAAAADPVLARLLARRVDFGPQSIPFAFLDLDGESRMKLIAEAERQTLATAALRGARPNGRQPPSRTEVAAVVAAAVARDPQRLAAAIGTALAVDEGTIAKLLADDSGEALAVAARAMAMDDTETLRFLLFAPPAPRSYWTVRRLVDLAETISLSAALRIVEAVSPFVPVRPPIRTAPAPSHEREAREPRRDGAPTVQPRREETPERREQTG